MELALTPSGRITVCQTTDPQDGPATSSQAAKSDGQIGRVAKAFATSQGEGLLLLATERFDGPLAPACSYWREFAVRYLTALCHTPEIAGLELEAIPPPTSAELATLVLCLPPMQGAEYLSEATLVEVWNDFDAWTRDAIAAGGEGLSGFLKQRAPLWHQVGRVCFHLAENRRSEDHPFAFLATYAPSVLSGSRVQYQPLSRALQEMAGVKNKTALVRLLSPVQTASQQSTLVKELLESGDIYQPLVWTPAEAYRFLKDAPLLEESGILVRLPDWWKKRPRPRVGVSIGDAKQKKFDAGTMLDFKVQLALGDQQLSEAEWRELMAADDGLVMLRGQWVEVDRQKLQEALDHWKQVEEQAQEGISFLEGMRLLAGVPADLREEAGGEEDRQWSFVHAGRWLGDVLAKMRSPENLQSAGHHGAMVAETLRATLRPYQVTGVNWLWFLSGLGLGACLADDMGLGKTIQVLALFLAVKNRKGASVIEARSASEAVQHQTSLARRASMGLTQDVSNVTTSSIVPKPSILVLPASLLGNWKAEMARFAPTLRAAFLHPAETPKDELDRIAADPEGALRGHRRRCHQLRHALASGLADEDSLAVGGVGRGAGHQEPGRPADQGRQAAAGRGPHRPDRHAGGEPLVRSLVAVRFSLSGLAGRAGPIQGVRQEAGRPPGEPLRAAAEPGATLHPAAAEDRPTHHRRPARQGRSAGVLRTFQAAGRDVRQTGPGVGRLVEERRRHEAAGAGAGLPDAVQTTLQPPQPIVGRRPIHCRGERQVRPAGRDLRRDRLASAAGPGLHAVPRDDRAAGGVPGAVSSAVRGWCSTAARP